MKRKLCLIPKKMSSQSRVGGKKESYKSYQSKTDKTATNSGFQMLSASSMRRYKISLILIRD